jgi:4-amino-4-deoxy-L-arabinose transferase-like glycosyltransferase
MREPTLLPARPSRGRTGTAPPGVSTPAAATPRGAIALGWRSGFVQAGLLGAIALAVRLVQLDHTPYVDELNHAIAARSLLTDGTLTIPGGGEYVRGRLFTWLVAGANAIFGDNLAAARVPAVLAGVALVVAVFAWLRRVAGGVAAWTGALLLALAPISIYLSQQVRFYTLQALLFWGGAVLVYLAAEGTSRGDASPSTDEGQSRLHVRALLAAGAVLCFAIAYHLQLVTAVGVAALCAWLAVDRGPTAVRWMQAAGAGRTLVVVAAAAVVMVVIAQSGWVQGNLARMEYADVWAEDNRTNLRFYHDVFLSQYPTLWTLFPVAVLVGASRHLRAMLFCVIIFGAAFVFHSLAAWKHERYLFHALPFFFAAWGIAAAVILPWLHRQVRLFVRRASGARAGPRMAGALATLLLVAGATFAAYGNTATSVFYRMLTVSDSEWGMSRAYRGEADWAAVLPELRDAADASDVVLTSAMLKAIYYLGRVEMGLSATEVTRGNPDEFAPVHKEGVPVISLPESMALVRECVASGLVIADERSWRRAWGVTPEVADYIEANTERLALPPEYGVLAFRWSRTSAAQRAGDGGAGGSGAAACAPVLHALGPPAS